jgi:hypothetical protein
MKKYLTILLAILHPASMMADTVWVRHPGSSPSEFESELFRVGDAVAFVDAHPIDDRYRGDKQRLIDSFAAAQSHFAVANYLLAEREYQKILQIRLEHDWDAEARALIAQAFLRLAENQKQLSRKAHLLREAATFYDEGAVVWSQFAPTLQGQLLQAQRQLQTLPIPRSVLAFDAVAINGKKYPLPSQLPAAMGNGLQRITFLSNRYWPQTRIVNATDFLKWRPEVVAFAENCRQREVKLQKTALPVFQGAVCGPASRRMANRPSPKTEPSFSTATPLASSEASSDTWSDSGRNNLLWIIGGTMLAVFALRQMGKNSGDDTVILPRREDPAAQGR